MQCFLDSCGDRCGFTARNCTLSGNAGRNAVSIADLPVYATFGFGQKLYLGLLSIERVFIANADIVFFWWC